MARGLPAVWSALFSLPFLVGGAHVYLNDPNETVPPDVGIPIIVFGLFIMGLGFYIQYIAAPEPPTMRDGEEVIDTRNPANRAAIVKSVIGFSFLLVAGYLYFFTYRPYVYPTSTFVVGLYLFSTGMYAYWTNTLTTYYITNQRLIKEFRFISLVRQEVPFDKVRGVQERKSVWEALVGLGNVSVASGGGASLEIVVRNIYWPEEFADEIRNFI